MIRGPVGNLVSTKLHSKPIASAVLDHGADSFMSNWQKMNASVSIPHIFS